MTQQDYKRAEEIQKCIRNKQYFLAKLINLNVQLTYNHDIITEDYAIIVGDEIFGKEIEIFKDRISSLLHEQIAALEKEFDQL